jgi:hypothetical protein
MALIMLPNEILTHIISFLNEDQMKIRLICRKFYWFALTPEKIDLIKSNYTIPILLSSITTISSNILIEYLNETFNASKIKSLREKYHYVISMYLDDFTRDISIIPYLDFLSNYKDLRLSVILSDLFDENMYAYVLIHSQQSRVLLKYFYKFITKRSSLINLNRLIYKNISMCRGLIPAIKKINRKHKITIRERYDGLNIYSYPKTPYEQDIYYYFLNNILCPDNYPYYLSKYYYDNDKYKSDLIKRLYDYTTIYNCTEVFLHVHNLIDKQEFLNKFRIHEVPKFGTYSIDNIKIFNVWDIIRSVYLDYKTIKTTTDMDLVIHLIRKNKLNELYPIH